MTGVLSTSETFYCYPAYVAHTVITQHDLGEVDVWLRLVPDMFVRPQTCRSVDRLTYGRANSKLTRKTVTAT